jgi:hypothetical protein
MRKIVETTPTSMSQVWLLMRTFIGIHPAGPNQPFSGWPSFREGVMACPGQASGLYQERRKKESPARPAHTPISSTLGLVRLQNRPIVIRAGKTSRWAALQRNGLVVNHHPPARSFVDPALNVEDGPRFTPSVATGVGLPGPNSQQGGMA